MYKRQGVESTLVKTLLEKEILEERFVQEDRPILRDAKSIERPSLSLAQEKALTHVKTKPTLIETRMGKNCYEKEKLHLRVRIKDTLFFQNAKRLSKHVFYFFKKGFVRFFWLGDKVLIFSHTLKELLLFSVQCFRCPDINVH